MKHILNFRHFKQSINEAFSFGDYSVNKDAKLNQAADIILSFLNKKTGKQFAKFPFLVNTLGVPGVMLYSKKDNSPSR